MNNDYTMNNETTRPEPAPAATNAEAVAPAALVVAAEASFQRGDLPAAIQSLKLAVDMKPEDFDLLLCLGNTQYHAKDFVGAAGTFTRAARLRPSASVGHLSRAAALVEQGDSLEAEGAVRVALALEPQNLHGLKFLRRLLLDGQRFAEAVLVCETILQQQPADTTTLLALGRCRYDLGDRQGASQAFEEVLRLEPGNQIALENLAHVRGRQTESPNQTSVGEEVIGAAGDTRFSKFRFLSRLLPQQTYQQIKQLKIDLIAGYGSASSIRDFGGLWGVHGLYLLQGARALRCRYAEMVDVTPRAEFQEKIAELHRTMPLEVKMTQGDFRDPRLFYPLQSVEVSLLYEVLLHQDNAVEVIKNVVNKTTRCVCVAQPVMKEELFALPNGSVNLQFYPEELKDQLRYSGWWEKEPATDRFTTGYWMWGQTTSHLTSIFHGYGWKPTFLETYEASPFWNYLMVRFEPRQRA